MTEDQIRNLSNLSPDERQYVEDNLRALRARRDERDASFIEKAARYLPDFAERGVLDIKKQALGPIGPDSSPEDIADKARYNRRQEEIPMDAKDAEALQKIRDSKGFLQTTGNVLSNLDSLLPVIGQGVVASTPQIASIVALGPAGRAASIAGSSAVTGTQEYLSALDEFYQEKGYDLTDEKVLRWIAGNEQLRRSADEFAVARAEAMTGANAASLGVAGGAMAAARAAGRSLAKAAGKELVQQSAIQGAGEAAAQEMSTGEIKPGQVAIAGTAGAIAQLPEVALAGRSRVRAAEAPERVTTDEIDSTPEIVNIAPESLDAANETATPLFDDVPSGDRQVAEPTTEKTALDIGKSLSDIDDAISLVNTPEPTKGESLFQFIRKTGGIKDSGGELKSRELSNKDLPGLIRNNGNTFDDMALKAWEAGYFPGAERPDVNTFLDAIDRERAGNRVYKPEFAEYDNNTITQARQFLDELGIDPAKYKKTKFSETPDAAKFKAQDIPFSATKKPPVVPTSSGAKALPALQNQVTAAIKRMNPSVKVEAVNELFGGGSNIVRSGADVVGDQPVAGGYDRLNNMIKVSMDTKRFDPMDTAYHEGWHSIEKLMNPADKAILLDSFPAMGNMNHAERAAIAYAKWATGSEKQAPVISSVFGKIKKLSNEVTNAVKGRGFKSHEDIFERAKAGKVAQEAGIKPLESATTPEQSQESINNLEYSIKNGDSNQQDAAVGEAFGIDKADAKSTIAEQRARLRRDMGIDDSKSFKERYSGLPKDIRSYFKRAEELNSTLIGSSAGTLRVMGRRFKSKTLLNLADMLYPEKGTDRVAINFFEEEKQLLAQKARGEIYKVLTPIRNNTKALERVSYLVGNRKEINTRSGSQIDVAAAKISELLDGFIDKMQKAGVKVNKTEDYMPAPYDIFKVLTQEDKFIQAATRAYMADFREKGLNIDEAQARSMAENWYKNMDQEEGVAFINGEEYMTPGAPKPNFLKSRVFGKAARAELREFMINDPVAALTAYVDRASNLIAYEKRFSPEKLKAMDEAMKAEGVPKDKREKAFRVVRLSTGRHGVTVSPKIRNSLEWIQYYNSLVTLPRSAISSFMEPVVGGVQTGSLKGSFGTMKDSLKLLFSGSKNRKELEENFAMVAGLINEIGARDLLSSRSDFGTFGDSTARRRSERFFDVIGLTRLTYVQRLAAGIGGNKFLSRISQDFLNGKDMNYTRQVFREYGIPDADMKEFANYASNLNERGRDVGESKMNDMYSIAIKRHMDSVIQPNYKATRPMYANHPVGKVFYLLQSYINNFTQNQLLRSARLAKKGLTERDLTVAERAKYLAPAVMLSTIFAAAQAALLEGKQVVYYNPDQAEQTDMGEIYAFLNQAGYSGNYGVLMNTMRAVGYGKDPASVISGPLLGNFSNVVKTSAQAALYNNPKTNTQERNLAKAVWSQGVQPLALNLVVTRMPGPVGAFVSSQAISHPATRSVAVDSLAGEKKKKKD